MDDTEKLRGLITASMDIQLNHARMGDKLIELHRSLYAYKIIGADSLLAMSDEDRDDVKSFRFMDKLFGVTPGHGINRNKIWYLAILMGRLCRDMKSISLTTAAIRDIIKNPSAAKEVFQKLRTDEMGRK